MNKKKNKLQKCFVNGDKFWYRGDDRYVGQRIALGKYEPYLTKMILDRVNSNSVVVDVGANIGYYTVLLADKVRKIYAFEPEKVNFEILDKNIKENKLENVRLFKKAAGKMKGKKKIYGSEDNYGDWRLFSGRDDHKGRPYNTSCGGGSCACPLIEIVKLDDVIKEKIDLIKIDTQGWEPEVIAGAKNLIRQYHPQIFFEWSPKMYREAGLDYQAMWDFLREEYNKIYYIDEYIQVYYPVEQCQQECNLWVGKSNLWEQYRNFWSRKWLKRLLGRPAT